MGNIDFANDRALRAWCIREVFLRMGRCELEEYIRMLDYIYRFVSGVKEVEISIKDGETVKKITAPAGVNLDFEVVRR